LCEAHRVAHAHPSTPEALKKALDAAWSEGRHSVVEVTTSRARNLAQHRLLQRRVAETVDAALALGERFGDERMSLRGSESDSEKDEDVVVRWPKSSPRAVARATVSRFALPMLREPTTTVKPSSSGSERDDTSNGEDLNDARRTNENDDSEVVARHTKKKGSASGTSWRFVWRTAPSGEARLRLYPGYTAKRRRRRVRNSESSRLCSSPPRSQTRCLYSGAPLMNGW
jgi:hypothetical protein